MASASATEMYTICVFQDVAWATRAVQALNQHGFTAGVLSFVAKDSPEAAALIEQASGVRPERVDIPVIGSCLAVGTLVSTLQGEDGGLLAKGLAATFQRAGFQAHDGCIFETLTARGGMLVGVRSEPRAADALAVLHAYGGGNAAIGAWHGRV
jgi:hypothetical protein